MTENFVVIHDAAHINIYVRKAGGSLTKISSMVTEANVTYSEVLNLREVSEESVILTYLEQKTSENIIQRHLLKVTGAWVFNDVNVDGGMQTTGLVYTD